jgi:hypothetical protein
MQTRFVQARSVSPGLGWAALEAGRAAVARAARVVSELVAALQQRLIDHTLHCIHAVQRLSRLPSPSDRAGAVSERWSAAMGNDRFAVRRSPGILLAAVDLALHRTMEEGRASPAGRGAAPKSIYCQGAHSVD